MTNGFVRNRISCVQMSHALDKVSASTLSSSQIVFVSLCNGLTLGENNDYARNHRTCHRNCQHRYVSGQDSWLQPSLTLDSNVNITVILMIIMLIWISFNPGHRDKKNLLNANVTEQSVWHCYTGMETISMFTLTVGLFIIIIVGQEPEPFVLHTLSVRSDQFKWRIHQSALIMITQQPFHMDAQNYTLYFIYLS